jgi:hypothetical protein
MNSDKNIIIIYILIFLCIIAIIFLFRKNKTELSKSHALNYSMGSESTQAIATIDSSGNLSHLSFPTGIIVVWYPTDSTMTSLALVSTTVPKGWAICDGTKGTPDLRGRFVLMAQDAIPVAPANIPNGSTPHPIMSIGGEEKHTLTNAEMPSHNHNYTVPRWHGGDSGGGGSRWNISDQQDLGSSHQGGNQPHNIMPSFYTLVYIMRL